jgi:hypothetical protein
VSGASVVDPGPPDGSSICPSQIPSGVRVFPDHRATAKTCAPTSNLPDAGGQPCGADVDCATDAGFPASLFTHCVERRCSFDYCLTDADCGAQSVCVCSSDYYGGNSAYHANECVPADCHTDADCGATGYCVPTRGSCGSFTGFHCMKATDPCVDAATDCAGCGFTLPACVYSPIAGEFVCGQGFGCNG